MILLRLAARLILPREVRDRYLEELIETARRQRAELPEWAPHRASAFWMRQMVGLASLSWQVRRKPPKHSRRFQASPTRNARLPNEAGTQLENAHGKRGGDMQDRFAIVERSALVLQDVRIATRGVVRSPLFSLAVFATLTLGITGLVATYALLDSIVLEGLPYPASEELVDIYSTVPGLGFERWEVTEAGYSVFAQESRTLDGLGGYRSGSVTAEGEMGAERVPGAVVTPSLLEVLRVQPLLGRLFTSDDAVPGARPVALLGYDRWMSRYGADADIIGKTRRILDRDHEIIGVLPSGFALPEFSVDIWLPLPIDGEPDADSHSLRLIGRVERGSGVAAVDDELARLTSRFPELFPSNYSAEWMQEAQFGTVVQSLHDSVVSPMVRRTLIILVAAAGLLLVVALANVMNLFAVRNLDRRGEFHLRRALGAKGSAILRFHFAEALLLCFTAGAAGIIGAVVTLGMLRTAAPAGFPRLSSLSVDASAAVVVCGLVAMLSLLLAVLPSVHSAKDSRLSLATRETGPSGTSSRRSSAIRGGLVTGQLALTVILLNASGLFLTSYHELTNVDPGFAPSGVIAVDVSLPRQDYPDQRTISAFYIDVLERVRAIPGVATAGATTSIPLEAGLGCYSLWVESNPLASEEQPPCVDVHVVTAGYFEAMGIPIEDGRTFTTEDNEQATGALVVTRTLADRLWHDRRPIGEGASIHGYREPWFRVVGVTGELLADGLDAEPTAAVYFPMVSPDGARQFMGHLAGMTIVARSRLEHPHELVPAIRRAIAEVDPGAATANSREMTRVVAGSRARTTVMAGSLLVTAAGALLLGAIGLYAAIAQSVRQRTREIGIRLALGAAPSRVHRLVLGRSSYLITAGLVLGFAGYVSGAGLLRGTLFGVSTTDPLILTATALVVLVVSGLATVIPARRASTIDPALALRQGSSQRLRS